MRLPSFSGFPLWYRDLLRDLAGLLRSGLPVLEALDTLRSKEGGPRNALLSVLERQVRGGSTLAEAFAAAPGVPPGDPAVIQAGEESGTLDQVLDRLVARIDRTRNYRNQLSRRLIQPVLTLIGAVVLLPLFLLVSGQRGLYLAIEGAFFLGVPALFLLGWFFSRGLLQNAPLRLGCERLLLRLPILGSLLHRGASSESFSLLGLLVGAGLPLARSLGLTAGAARLGILADAFQSIACKIQGGSTFAEAFRAQGVFARSPSWAGRLAAGEKAGALDQTLSDLGQSLEEEQMRRLDRLAAVLPIVLVVLLGAVVLWRAIAVYTSIIPQGLR